MTKAILAAATGFLCVMLAAAIQTDRSAATTPGAVVMQIPISAAPNRAQAYSLASNIVEG